MYRDIKGTTMIFLSIFLIDMSLFLSLLLLSSLSPFGERERGGESIEKGWHGHVLTEAAKQQNREYLKQVRELK